MNGNNSQLRRRVSRLTTGCVWLLLLPCELEFDGISIILLVLTITNIIVNIFIIIITVDGLGKQNMKLFPPSSPSSWPSSSPDIPTLCSALPCSSAPSSSCSATCQERSPPKCRLCRRTFKMLIKEVKSQSICLQVSADHNALQ